MIRDDAGLDTVFGALILILMCLGTSSLLMLSSPFEEAAGPDIGDLEREFNCILSSTFELRYSFEGVEALRTLTIGSFVLEESQKGFGSNSSASVGEASNSIETIIDFYMSGFDGWNLRLIGNTGPLALLSSRGESDQGGVNAYVLTRSLIGPNREVMSLDLVIFD